MKVTKADWAQTAPAEGILGLREWLIANGFGPSGAVSVDMSQVTGDGFSSGQYPMWNGSQFVPSTITPSDGTTIEDLNVPAVAVKRYNPADIQEVQNVWLQYELNLRTWGCAANGEQDDTLAITSAIQYLNAIGGGTLYAPAGTYLILGVPEIIASNVRIRGDGVGVTTFQFADVPGFVASGQITAGIDHCTLLSNGSGFTDGTSDVGSAFTLSNGSGGDAVVWAHDLDITGDWVTGITLSGVTGGKVARSRLIGMQVGVAMASVTDVMVWGNYIADTTAEAATLDGSCSGNSLWNVLSGIGAGTPYSGSASVNRFLFDTTSSSRLGMMQAGDGLLSDTDGIVSLRPATVSDIGGVIVGAGLAVDTDGTISVTSGSGSGNLPTVKVYRSGAQSIGTGGDTVITFDTESWDTSGFWSAGSPTRITIPSGLDGKYSFVASAAFAANASGVRWFMIWKNGAFLEDAVQNMNALSAVRSEATVALVDNCVAGDYYELYVFQNSGGSLNALANSCSLSAMRFSN